jgi:hypothetical protein
MDPVAKTVITRFPGDHWTGGPIVPEDDFHAANLGITMLEHRLLHEMAHHLVYRALHGEPCPILWAAAHKLAMPSNAKELEWLYTAASYWAYGVQLETVRDYGALMDLQRLGVDLGLLGRRLRWVVAAVELGPAVVQLG